MNHDQLHLRCRDAVACVDVVDSYLDAALLHAGGHHVLAEQYEATGDAVADRHQLWAQLEQDVAT